MHYSNLASDESIERTILSLSDRGIRSEIFENGVDAFQRLKELIPPNSSVFTGASLTLKQIGFEDLLIIGEHPYKNLKGEMIAEKNPLRQLELRRQSVLADFYVGSVHAISETGEIAVASATGSQLGAYAYSAKNIIWVAGTQKIVPTLDDGLKRIREYCSPKVEEEGFRVFGRHDMGKIGKILIFENEVSYIKRTVRLLFVKEVLGY